MWWREVLSLGERLAGAAPGVDPSATIEGGAVLDERAGPIQIGARTLVCAGAVLRGPLIIGADCLIGNMAMVRGPSLIGDRVRLGFAVEIKQALIGDGVAIGPQCFVGDSRIDADAYLGAQVRTSNQRLDRAPISVREDGRDVPTGSDKLGCWIGARAALGIQCIVLPGRVIAPDSLFEPRITVARNLPRGHYRLTQAIELA